MSFSVETYKRRWARVAWSWFGILSLGLFWVVWTGDGPGLMAIYNFPWVKTHQASIHWFTDWGLYPFYLMFAGLLAVGYYRGDKRLVTVGWGYLGAQLTGSLLVVHALKKGLGRERPDPNGSPDQGNEWIGFTWESHYHSFPSGHMADVSTGALFAALLLGGWKTPPFFVLAAAVGLSRVALASHYPADVVAGAAIGGAIALLTWRWWVIPRLDRIGKESK